MNGILADINIRGYVVRIVQILESSEWAELWHDLNLELVTFPSLGLTWTTPDRVILETCWERNLWFITANRNHDDADSVQATLQDSGAEQLPIFTISNMNALRNDSSYLHSVAIDLLDYLLDHLRDPESLIGQGRIFLPKRQKH